GPAIQLHAFAALAAFGLGAAQLAAPKGTLPHRAVGWAWVTLMVIVAGSSFWIHELRVWGPWSPIHLLAIYTRVDKDGDHGLAVLDPMPPRMHGRKRQHRQRLSSPAYSRSGPAASCMRCCSGNKKPRQIRRKTRCAWALGAALATGR